MKARLSAPFAPNQQGSVTHHNLFMPLTVVVTGASGAGKTPRISVPSDNYLLQVTQRT
jgi:hypothetical protein